jgi:hypothetical protein
MKTKMVTAALGIALALAGLASSASAAPLPDDCGRVQGTVTCTTFEGPGKNQAGVGTSESTETQGNSKNKSPEPQELEDTSSCKPPSSQGQPCNP